MGSLIAGGKTWMLWVNVGMVVLGLAVPVVKDLLTPELELAIVAVINGGLAIYNKMKGA